MKKQLLYKFLLALFILVLNLNPAGHALATSSHIPNLSINTKVLTSGRAIASWPSGIPSAEKRPIVVFLPGWGGVGAVNASISSQNTNLVNQGYVTLAIGFDSSSTWNSDIELKTLQGLDKLCTDATIPVDCNAIVLDGSSYGAAQNYWVMEYLHGNGYAGGVGSKGKALGFLSEDGGYGAPGTLTNPTTGAYTRTGLANTSSYAVAMIENLGDTTFPVDECTWGNCGARELSNAHLARGDNHVFSICPPGGEHGTRGFANWNAWVVSVIKTMIHITYGIPTFTGYTNPTLTVSNACINTSTSIVLPGLSVSGINIVANGQPVRLRGINMGDPFWARNPDWYPNYSIADYATISQDWHANVVRISIFPTQWKNMDHPTLLAGLAKEINAALNNGLYVIISYHVIGWPNGWYQAAYPGNPSDTYDSSLSVAGSFWTQMSQTYGSDKRIIFDLWNEPVHDSSDWQGTDPNPYWSELKLAYESLIQTVRNNGSQNIVLATGNRWASWLVGIKDNPLSDTNVVYAYHKYSVEGSNTPTEWNKDTGGLIGIKPVIVSEWGYEDTDVTNPTWPGSQSSYGDPFTQWMESNRLSNLAWMYHHDWTPALLKSDGSLTKYGTFVKNYIVESNIPIVFPTATSIVRAGSSPAKSTSVDFTIAFSNTVTGVDASDFSLTRSGVSGATISGVSGSGTTYTVTVNTGSGDGTIRLDLVDDDSIIDADSNPLGGPGSSNGNFTDGEAYTIDKTPPTTSSITRAKPNPSGMASVSFTVTFSEAVIGVDSSDFSLHTTGVTGTAISGVSGSGNTRTVTVNTGSGNGTIRLDLNDDDSITDPALNPLNGAGSGTFNTGDAYTITKPNLAAPALRLPASGLVTNDSTPTFSWTSVQSGQSYEIQVSTDNTFISNVTSDIVSALSDTLASPLTDAPYFWRVRAYNAGNQPGTWSVVRTLTIDTTGPAAPTLTSPADNASTSTPTFRWTSVASGISYQFQYDNDADFSSPRYTSTVRTNSIKPPIISKGTYHWHVRAQDAAGNWGAWSAPRTITISN